ncbi:MAG: TatD family hydrolase, partial [Candidatus Thorarchaeota archaeon]
LSRNPRLIDTHCHLEQEEFDNDRDAVIEKAAHQGIHTICSAITQDTWQKCLTISNAYKTVYASIGLDPLLTDFNTAAKEFILSNASDIVSIGEVGLDHYRERNHAQRDLQESVFKEFISIANELKIPIQVHSRSAGKSAIRVLEENDADAVHLHAFDGKSSYARTASNDLGYYFSIPTSVVRSPQKQKLVKAIAIEKLLLETDSPVLGPDKTERNEPSNIGIALTEVATILRRDEEELREIILENTLRLYTRIKSH